MHKKQTQKAEWKELMLPMIDNDNSDLIYSFV